MSHWGVSGPWIYVLNALILLLLVLKLHTCSPASQMVCGFILTLDPDMWRQIMAVVSLVNILTNLSLIFHPRGDN